MSSIEDDKRELEIQRKARQIAESQLEQKSRELYEKNYSLRDALCQLQQQLIAQEKQTSIGQLSAGLAHEINNPNAFIKSNLASLGQYLKGLIDAIAMMSEQIQQVDWPWLENVKAEWDLGFIQEDAQTLIDKSAQGRRRIQRIVQGLGYFTNPESQNKQFDVNACVSHTLELVGHELDLDVKYLAKKAYCRITEVYRLC